MITADESKGQQEIDRVEKFGSSLVQHGSRSDRVYLMHFYEDDFPGIIDQLERLCIEKNYGKIFAKVPARCAPAFLTEGYRIEGYVPGFFLGREDAFFLTRYFHEKRKRVSREYMQKFQELLSRHRRTAAPDLPEGFTFRAAAPGDTPEMAELYKTVFERYPFPIHDPEYLLETMESHVSYFGIWQEERLAALSSAEKDLHNLNAEMTDFAAHPDYRGKKLALHLLFRMEDEMKREGILTGYTIARLRSPGMNVTFLRAGYRYSGTLVNNTSIGGGLESMNVLYKRLG